MVSQTKSRVWWSFRKSGYFEKIALLVGSSMSDSRRHETVAPSLVEEVVDHLQRIEIFLFRKRRALERSQGTRDNLLEDVNWIRDQHSSNGRSADDEEFRGLEQDGDVAVLHQVTAQHCAEDDDDADDHKHGSAFWSRV